jgi:tetratricopeptide (TPR) repeat protein/TolB-like protein
MRVRSFPFRPDPDAGFTTGTRRTGIGKAAYAAGRSGHRRRSTLLAVSLGSSQIGKILRRISTVANAPAGLTDALRDRYRFERELGHGGMATVYLARDLKHDREVAVKVLRPNLAEVLGRDRFLVEVALTAKLDHPHILTLIDSGEAGGTLYYVLPYIRGESLRQRLAAEQQLPVDEAVRIGCQVAIALDYAHRRGVIHRDIKPENILLHEGEAMVTDFGIALAVREAAGERVTESGLSLGTPQYMSPEQAGGRQDVTGRSDLFSLGTVIYEMLTGEAPFRGATPQAVVARLMTQQPAPIRTVRDTVPAGVEAAVLKSLAKVPADRFSSGLAFASALREGMSPTGAGPAASDAGQRRGPARAGRWLLALAVVAAVIVVLSLRRVRSEAPAQPAGPVASPLVLVAPFQTGGGDTLAGSVARSISQAIADSLANISGLRAVVIADDTPQATDSLVRGDEVTLIVAGSVERSGNELKAIARVSEGPARIQRFAQGQQAPPGATQLLEADLVERVVRFVRRYVGTEVRRRAVAAETKDSVAREYWSRAGAMIDAISAPEARSLPTSSADRLLVADSLLREASRRDPQWIGPYIARGWAFLESAAIYGSEGQRDPARISAHLKAVAAADAAIRIAPDDPVAHELRGVALVGLWFETPSEQADSIGREAELELGRAISLDLNVARAWEALGTYYLFVGRFGEGRQAMAQAEQADEFLLSEPQILRWQILADLNLEHYDEARQTCARGARWYPLELAFMNCPYVILGWSAGDLKSARRAWRLARKAEDRATPARRSDVYRTNLLMTAAILARAGYRDSAESLLRTFEGTRKGPVDLDGFASDEAYVRLLVGQQDQALALLRTFLHNNWAQRGYIVRTPWFRSLQDNPAFVAMTGRRP